jgi:hypothetical protein
MFRASTCPSSRGQMVLSQHLVSSLSLNGCTVCLPDESRLCRVCSHQTKTAPSVRHLLLIKFTVSQIILELKVQTTFSLASCQYPPWNGVLLQKLILPQIVQKFPTFHGTRRFISLINCSCVYVFHQKRKISQNG